MTKKEKFLLFLIITFLFLIPFLWSPQNLYNLGGDDSRLYFYSPIDWLKNIAFYSWFGYFGSYNPQHAYVPLNILSLALKCLFPFVNLQKMFHGLILSLGFLTIFLILKELLKTKDKTSYYAAILGGLTYIFSPLIYYTQWFVPVTSLVGIIGYPLIFFFFFKAVREKRIEYLVIGVLISLVFSIIISSLSFPWLAAFLMGISLFYLLYIIFFPGQLKLVIKYGLIYIFFIILINALWFLPESFSFVQQAQLSVTSALSVSGREAAALTVKAVAHSMNIFDTLLNLLSRGLVYNWNWPQVRIAGYTYGLTPLNIFLPLIIFLPPLLRKKEKDNSIFKFWFALAIPTILLAYLQTVNIWKVGINFFNLLIRHLFGWSALRNFYHKVPPTYVFFYSLTLGVSLYIISKRISRPIIQRGAFLIVLLVIILQAFPFIRGAINNLPFHLDIETTMNVELPSYYFEALGTIEGLEEGKVLSLPLTHASWSLYKSKEGNGMYIGLSPILVFTGRNDFNGKLAFDAGERFIPGLSSLVKEAMQSRDYEFLGKLFGLLSLRYIVYNSEIYEDKTLEKIRKLYLWGGDDIQTKDNIENLIKRISDKRIGEFGPVSIYELSSKYYYPTIYSTNKAFLVNIETLVSMSYTKYLAEKPVLLFKEQMEKKPELKIKSQKKRPEVEFRQVNLTRYIVRVKASEPFWLVFSEAFHKGWRAYIRPVWSSEFASRPEGIRGPRGRARTEKDRFEWSALMSAWKDRGEKIELKEHFMVNGYANGWYIPVSPSARQPVSQLTNKQTSVAVALPPRRTGKQQATNEIEIVLEFVPQRLFEVGVLISGLTLLGCVGYLVGTGVGRKRRKAESR